MWRSICLVCSLASLVFVTTGVDATVCSPDFSPASTLVFPFVVLDYSGTETTIIGITNTGPETQIVHVTLWTDYGMSILVFNIVLSGYDLETFNVRDLLVDGIVPISSDPEGTDPVGGAIYRGPVTTASPLPAPDSSASVLDRCDSADWVSVPRNYIDPIPQSALDAFKGYLQMSQTQDRYHQSCGGTSYPLGDWYELRDTEDPTWMWITADVVWTCNKARPDTSIDYWMDGSQNGSFGHKVVANVLMGDVTWIDTATGESQSSAAIHLEADRSLGDKSFNSPILNPTTGMPQSFYHAFSSQTGSSDLREPLPTAWALRNFDDQGVAETWIRVFKAPSLTPDLDFPGLNGGTMLADDCSAYTYYAWDNDGTVVTGGSQFEPNLLPLATQEIRIDSFTIPEGYGWMMFQWPHTNAVTGDLYQTWVEIRDQWVDYGSNVRQAIPTANFNCDHGEIMSSGLELGNTSGWSSAQE